MISPERFHRNQGIYLLGVLFFIPFILGVLLPDDWWGTHFTAFLPGPWKYIVLLAGVILLSLPFFPKLPRLTVKDRLQQALSLVVITLLSITAGICFYQFPIVADYYGNARSFQPLLGDPVSELPPDFYRELFSFAFEPGNGRRGVFQVYTFIAYAFNLNYGEVFRWAGAVFGGAFLSVWLYAVRSWLSNRIWQLALCLAGVGAPFLWIFFGHIDTYAPLYFILLVWLLLFTSQLKSRNPLMLVVLTLLLVFGIRFHTLMYLLTPAWLLAVLMTYFPKAKLVGRWSSLRGVWLWIFLPFTLAGLYGYFFVLKDYNDPRVLDHFRDIDRLFLPIISPDPPYDRYNLQSWNHIFDFFNIMLLWSPTALFLVAVILTAYRKHLSNPPALNIMLLTMAMISSVLFVFNPLLSMPMDWDLFVFPAPILLVILLLLAQQVDHQPVSKRILLSCGGLALMALPVFAVNSLLKPLSYRMESVGIRVYKTYYAHAGAYLLYALQLIPDDPGLYLERKQQLIRKLEPWALPDNDQKYASLLTDNGIYQFKYLEAYGPARQSFERSLYYFPGDPGTLYYLLQTQELLLDYPAAYVSAVQLVSHNFPDRDRALRTAILYALEAGYYEQADGYCQAYLEDHDDPMIEAVRQRLMHDPDPEDVEMLTTLLRSVDR